MSQFGDVGISPVLLQAISQSITATSHSLDPPSTSCVETSKAGGCDSDNTHRLLPSNSVTSKMDGQELDSETVKQMLKIKMAANALSKSLVNQDGTIAMDKMENSSLFTTSAMSDLAMANMLTALASQSDSTTVASSNVGSQSLNVPTQTVSSETLQQRLTAKPSDKDETLSINPDILAIKSEIPVDTATNFTTTMATALQTASLQSKSVTNFDNSQTGSQPKIYLTSKTPAVVESQSMTLTGSMIGHDQINNGSVVIPDNQDQCNTVLDTVVIPHTGGQVIEYEGKRYLLQAPSGTSSIVGPTKYITIRTPSGGGTSDDSEVYNTVAGQEVVAITEGNVNEGSSVGLPTVQAYTGEEGPRTSSCPICGDEISGFHYGIFTCESCKGFFKRTVQNKKSFVCHRQGECEITLENRKKCPACRFAKCLVMGMKLDAIRQDRSRGGRSSYSGLSPLDEAKRKRQMKPIPKRPTISPSAGDSRLASALSYESPSVGNPFVPTVLTDIMNLESLLCDDDIPQNIKVEDFLSPNPSVFLMLLQLCELKLYKIVRWARNLPYFANISTDDQILLLQNCWCDLLALTMCWKSIHLTNEIVFFHGQTIDIEKARLLNLGDMFMCLLAEVEQLKRLKLDQYEFVAMKVVILITPDIKGLNDAERLGIQQQKISEALEQYTSSHYKQNQSKYGELLLRLPELSRISFMLKEQLLSWMPQDNTSCGLLFELLKGENMKELV